MPIVHQDKRFDFVIKAEDKEPAKVHITGLQAKFLLIRIGKPGEELPRIDKVENVDQDEINWAWNTISDYQENFLIAWRLIHSGEWEIVRGPVRIGVKAEPVVVRLKLKSKINKDRLKELVGMISDKRFSSLKKLFIWDLDKSDFKSISLALYMRLGSWSNTGGTYTDTMNHVRGLCKAMFGYELPEKIGTFSLKGYRYRAGKSLPAVWPVISRYHEERQKKA